MFCIVRKSVAAVAVLVGGVLLVNAQSYQVHRVVPRMLANQTEEIWPRAHFLDIHISAVASIGNITEGEGYLLSRYMVGVRYGLMWYVMDSLGIGVEWESLEAKDKQTEYLEYIKQEILRVGGKWIVTPDTEPKMYLLVGVGYLKNRSKFELNHNHLDGYSLESYIGVGEEVSIYKGIKVRGEYRYSYAWKRWEKFVLTGSKVRQELSAGISWEF